MRSTFWYKTNVETWRQYLEKLTPDTSMGLGASAGIPAITDVARLELTEAELHPLVTYPTSEELLSIRVAANWKLDYSIASKYVDLAIRHENPNGFPSRYDILAIIRIESNFNPNAKDPLSPSYGLMQINVDAHKQTVAKMLNPEENVKYGAELLKRSWEATGREAAALVHYNAGPVGLATICAGRKVCTSSYSAKVLKAKAGALRKGAFMVIFVTIGKIVMAIAVTAATIGAVLGALWATCHNAFMSWRFAS